MPPAQTYNKWEVKVKQLTSNIGIQQQPRPLSEARAIELGAVLLSELFIFGLAVSIAAFEISRQSYNSSIKKLKVGSERNDFIAGLNNIKGKIETHQVELEKIKKKLTKLSHK